MKSAQPTSANTKPSPSELALWIERDPASWKNIAFACWRTADEVNAKQTGNWLLGEEAERMDSPRNARGYFRTSDTAADWRLVSTLCRSMMADVQEDAVAKKTSADKQPSILVVEDDPMTSEMMTLALKKFGTVIASSNAREAVANYMVHRPDMVFLDIHYVEDNADGFDVLKNLLSADSNAFIIMVSSDHTAAGVIRAFQMGAQGFAAKPLRPEHCSYYLGRLTKSRR